MLVVMVRLPLLQFENLSLDHVHGFAGLPSRSKFHRSQSVVQQGGRSPSCLDKKQHLTPRLKYGVDV